MGDELTILPQFRTPSGAFDLNAYAEHKRQKNKSFWEGKWLPEITVTAPMTNKNSHWEKVGDKYIRVPNGNFDFRTAEDMMRETEALNASSRENKSELTTKQLVDDMHNATSNAAKTIGAATLAGIGAGAISAGLISSPLVTLGSLAGGHLWDLGTKKLTGKSWGLNVYDWTGVPELIGDLSNPGFIAGGIGGNIFSNFSKNQLLRIPFIQTLVGKGATLTNSNFWRPLSLNLRQDAVGSAFGRIGNITSPITLQIPTRTLKWYPKIVSETGFKPRRSSWTDGTGRGNQATHYFWNDYQNQRFELVKDDEPGFWSVHFKTDKDVLPKDRKLGLFDKLAGSVPLKDAVSTYGSVSPGGIHGVNRFGNDYNWNIVGYRLLTDKNGNPIQLPIFSRLNKNTFKLRAVLGDNYSGKTFGDSPIDFKDSNIAFTLRFHQDTRALAKYLLENGVDLSHLSADDLSTLQDMWKQSIKSKMPNGRVALIDRNERFNNYGSSSEITGYDDGKVMGFFETMDKPKLEDRAPGVGSTEITRYKDYDGKGVSEFLYNTAIESGADFGYPGVISGHTLVSPELTRRVWRHYPIGSGRTLYAQNGTHYFGFGRDVTDSPLFIKYKELKHLPVYLLTKPSYPTQYKYSNIFHPDAIDDNTFKFTMGDWNTTDAFGKPIMQALPSESPYKFKLGSVDAEDFYKRLMQSQYLDYIFSNKEQTGKYITDLNKLKFNHVKFQPRTVENLRSIVGPRVDESWNSWLNQDGDLIDVFERSLKDAVSKGYVSADQYTLDKMMGRSKSSGGYFPDRDRIAILEGSEDFAGGHELRHALQKHVRLSPEQEKIRDDAWNFPKAKELFADDPEWQNIDIDAEKETTNFDFIKQLLGSHINSDYAILKRIIEKATDLQIFEAASKANGYGRRYILYLREHGLLTPEKAQQLRTSAIKVDALSIPLVIGSLTNK